MADHDTHDHTGVPGVGGSIATDTIWDAAGDLVQGTGANTAAKLSAGASGKVLTANGAAAALTWETPGSGSLVLLEQHTANNTATSLAFTTFISSTYDDYMIEIVELACATNAVDLLWEIGTGGGPTYDTGNNYEWSSSTLPTAGALVTDVGTTGDCRIFKALSNNAAYGFGNFTGRITGLQSTAHRKTIFGNIQYVNSTPAALNGYWGAQWVTSGTAATALRFITTSGNIASGTIRIYGIAK